MSRLRRTDDLRMNRGRDDTGGTRLRLGYMRRREASINDVPIEESQRRVTPGKGELPPIQAALAAGLSTRTAARRGCDRQAAREAVVKYPGSQLAALQERVGAALNRFRAGELDAFGVDVFGVDRVPFHYSRAAE